MPPEKLTQEQLEQGFRDELSKVVDLVKVMQPHCNSLEDLVEIVSLALANDSQLRIIMKLAIGTPTPPVRR